MERQSDYFYESIGRRTQTKKTVWVADSFKGLPRPDEKYAVEKDDHHYIFDEMAVSLAEVKKTFESTVFWMRRSIP